MTDAEAFAEALSRALGPLYRVVVMDDAGASAASFGRLSEGRQVGEPIPFPGGNGSIVNRDLTIGPSKQKPPTVRCTTSRSPHRVPGPH